jgi:multidrug resistance efflux pump
LDPSALLDANSRLIEARRRLEEAREEAASLRVQQEALRDDLSLWRSEMLTALAARHAVATLGLAAARSRLDTATAMLSRYGNLAKVGAVNLQRLDDVRLAHIIAGHDLAGAQSELQRIQAERVALDSGLMLAGVDRPSTQQRLDAIEIRLATLYATTEGMQQAIASLSEEQAIRERQHDRETRIELRAPGFRRIWRLFVRPDERVAPQAAIASLIDCDRVGVSAIFHQRNLDSLHQGRRVIVRVAGMARPLMGRIVDVDGYYDSDTKPAEAVAIRALDKGSVLVRVEVPATIPGCLVGLHAAVRLD